MPLKPWQREDCVNCLQGAAVGMVHLPALPGSPGWQGNWQQVLDLALADAAVLAEAGFAALMVENFNDIPFHRDQVPALTVSAMTVVINEIRRQHPTLSLGVNVLRNDVSSALAIATVTGASFVRVNVHTGASVTDQGVIQGQAWQTLRERQNLGAQEVAILADLRVKHARPLAERPLLDEARDLRLRGLADAIIVTGEATGSGADPGQLSELRSALPDCPLIVGSGLNTQTIPEFFPLADACIVGSSLKAERDSQGWAPVSLEKSTEFIQTLAQAREAGD